MIDKELLEILACPECKGDVAYDEANQKIVCCKCGLKYPVRDGIPVMLVEEAEKD
ncbi:MAG TPA: Trm112 family protein [bacterium]|nr:Trm112 family protein [bacterium]